MKFETSNVISTIALVLSIPSLFFSARNYLRSKPKIKLTESENYINSTIIEPEFNSKESKLDIYQNFRYRVLVEITIKNVSSNPITVISVNLNDHFDFGPYTSYVDTYAVKTKSHKHLMGKGVYGFGESEKINFDLTNRIIRMPLFLKPFEAVKGYIIFPIKNSDLQYIKTSPALNNLKLETTFKNFEFNIHIKKDKIFKRDKSLEHNDNWD